MDPKTTLQVHFAHLRALGTQFHDASGSVVVEEYDKSLGDTIHFIRWCMQSGVLDSEEGGKVCETLAAERVRIRATAGTATTSCRYGISVGTGD